MCAFGKPLSEVRKGSSVKLKTWTASTLHQFLLLCDVDQYYIAKEFNMNQIQIFLYTRVTPN